MDVAKAVREVKQGKSDFNVDKSGIVHTSIGKVSFSAEQSRDNAKEFISTLNKLKPVSYTHLDVYKRQLYGDAVFCQILLQGYGLCGGKYLPVYTYN